MGCTGAARPRCVGVAFCDYPNRCGLSRRTARVEVIKCISSPGSRVLMHLMVFIGSDVGARSMVVGVWVKVGGEGRGGW